MMAYYNNYLSGGQNPLGGVPKPFSSQFLTLIPVRGREVAMNWAVAPGTSAIFVDETAPYLYVKTVGFSPLGQVSFDVYPLKKEETAQKAAEAPQTAFISDEGKNALDEINGQISRLWQAVEEIKGGTHESASE